jgi:hypothetical protein
MLRKPRIVENKPIILRLKSVQPEVLGTILHQQNRCITSGIQEHRTHAGRTWPIRQATGDTHRSGRIYHDVGLRDGRCHAFTSGDAGWMQYIDGQPDSGARAANPVEHLGYPHRFRASDIP